MIYQKWKNNNDDTGYRRNENLYFDVNSNKIFDDHFNQTEIGSFSINTTIDLIVHNYTYVKDLEIKSQIWRDTTENDLRYSDFLYNPYLKTLRYRNYNKSLLSTDENIISLIKNKCIYLGEISEIEEKENS